MELVKVKIETEDEAVYQIRLVAEGTPMTYSGAYQITKDLFDRFKAAKEVYQAVEIELDTEVERQDLERNDKRSRELNPGYYEQLEQRRQFGLVNEEKFEVSNFILTQGFVPPKGGN